MAKKDITDTSEVSEGQSESQQEEKTPAKLCGVIMPIAKTENYPESHWAEVLEIITEAFEDTDFTTRLVSSKDSIGLIHESIVTNIFSDELAVCDVSSRNPNVMFELGLRLAFDKPVIIIKDERTPYSFDTSPIEHLSYPSSLRFKEITEFKKSLKAKALATHKHYSDNPDESPYLKSFNKVIVPGKIKNVEVSDFQYVINKVNQIGELVINLDNNAKIASGSHIKRPRNSTKIYKNRILYQYLKYFEDAYDEMVHHFDMPSNIIFKTVLKNHLPDSVYLNFSLEAYDDAIEEFLSYRTAQLSNS